MSTSTLLKNDEPTSPEIATAIKVVDFFGRHADMYDSPSIRPLRCSMQKIIEREQTKRFGGKTLKQYVSDRFKIKLAEHRKEAKEEDRRKVDRCRLRAERLKKRNALIAQARIHCSSADSLFIPDGPVQTALEINDGAQENEQLFGARRCYICKDTYRQLHHFYDRLCLDCAELNWSKRHQCFNLRGKTALVTGCRIKIGFEIALKLLRAGATVIGTSRFPYDAAQRFSREHDFCQWEQQLSIYRLDFQHIASVEHFCTFLSTKLDKLDIVINNAAQTIHRPNSYYQHVVDLHRDKIDSLEQQIVAVVNRGLSTSNQLKEEHNLTALAVRDCSQFDGAIVDVHGHALDLRSTNSWTQKLGEVDTSELVQVFAINTVAPFILCGKLQTLLLRNRQEGEPKFIVNVSAMEGKFEHFKKPTHPHTNMAKAALNMLTRTSAEDLAEKGIYMNSVDTGWVNDQRPVPTAVHLAAEAHFQAPLDEIDGAARVLDPIFEGIRTEQCSYGHFLKDYKPTDW
uniref:Oxidoreductase n=1 Tax=Plectus sambesii TaxID=2011161 RepID=A0A914VYR7_9BILA